MIVDVINIIDQMIDMINRIAYLAEGRLPFMIIDHMIDMINRITHLAEGKLPFMLVM